jgi:hypothetical protein
LAPFFVENAKLEGYIGKGYWMGTQAMKVTSYTRKACDGEGGRQDERHVVKAGCEGAVVAEGSMRGGNGEWGWAGQRGDVAVESKWVGLQIQKKRATGFIEGHHHKWRGVLKKLPEIMQHKKCM